jgi:hypothetical protein
MQRISRSAPGWATGLALTALVGLGVALTSAVQAQQKAQDTVPFKIVITSKARVADAFILPFEPPLAVGKATGAGSNELLGQVTHIELNFLQFGVDGTPLWAEGTGVMTAANGDAVFFTYKGAAFEPVKTGFTITGGKGRFKGASGSGIMTPSPVPGGNPEEDFLCNFDGVITAPKPEEVTGLSGALFARYRITGGKGRFKDARGSGQMTFTFNEGTGEFTCTFEGFITAPK